MTLLPLALGVRSPSGAEFVFAKIKSTTEKALKRDDYTCRFCGFHAKKFQRAVPWSEGEDSPAATACIFCEQVLNLERAATTGAGILIWLPEITQAQLNHMARAIYVGKASENDEVSTLATRALDSLTQRRSDAKKRLGTDDPTMLAMIFRESLSDKELGKAPAKLDGVRLLPSEKYIVRGPKGDANQFPMLVRYWASDSYDAWPVDKWLDTLKTALSKTGNA